MKSNTNMYGLRMMFTQYGFCHHNGTKIDSYATQLFFLCSACSYKQFAVYTKVHRTTQTRRVAYNNADITNSRFAGHSILCLPIRKMYISPPPGVRRLCAGIPKLFSSFLGGFHLCVCVTAVYPSTMESIAKGARSYCAIQYSLYLYIYRFMAFFVAY